MAQVEVLDSGSVWVKRSAHVGPIFMDTHTHMSGAAFFYVMDESDGYECLASMFFSHRGESLTGNSEPVGNVCVWGY